MFGIKSVYFYLIALQITLIKFLKKIYFSSNSYNNSLKSKTPQQAHYNPNPFLLSIITDYKKNLLKSVKLIQIYFGLKIRKKTQKSYIIFFG